MLEFHELKEYPSEPPGTIVRYRIEYGSVNGERSHIAIFGIMPANMATRKGCVWLEMLCERHEIPLAALRDARAAFADFLNLTNWQLVCIVKKEGKTENNFVRFLGFEPFHELDNDICYKGPNYGR